MKPGISTACLYPMETEKALETVCAQGAKTVDIFFNSPRELEPDFVYKLKGIADSHGAKVIALHPFCSAFEGFMFFSDYIRRYEDMLDYYGNFFRAANILGADILVIHGDRDHFKLSDEKYLERFDGLVSRGLEFGVRVAHENVTKYRGATAEFMEKLRITLGDHAFFVFDFKQAVRAGVPYPRMIKAMGDRIIHVHVSDSNEHDDCLLPGHGNKDFAHADRLIKASGCNPQWMIEVYSRCISDYSQLAEASRYLEGIL